MADTARTQKERTELSDQRMTEAAVQLLVEKGIKGTTLAAIGKRSGYSRGLATHRFGSKAGMLAHVHDTIAAQWLQHVRTTVGEATGIDALLRVADALYRFIVDQPIDLRAMYLLRYASIDPAADFGGNVATVNRAHVRALSRWISEAQSTGDVDAAVDPHTTALVFASMVDGLLYRWFIDADLEVEAALTAMREQTHRMLAPR